MNKLAATVSTSAVLLASFTASCAPGSSDPEAAGWEERASGITIIRDDWGIAHVYGETDADAVFGMVYAQAEDDFNRIEINFLNSQGRLAEAEGESEIYRDLRMKLFIDPVEMQAHFQATSGPALERPGDLAAVITPKSSLTSERGTGSAASEADAPATSNRLSMLLPTTLPMAMSELR